MQESDYNDYKQRMSDYESKFDTDSLFSLKKMVDLYFDLKGTNFHDIADAIELWIDAYPDKGLLDYIKNKKDNEYFHTLVAIIENN